MLAEEVSTDVKMSSNEEHQPNSIRAPSFSPQYTQS